MKYLIINVGCFWIQKNICELNYANFQGIEEIQNHSNNYKGSKKPNFYKSNENDNNNKIEIPYKYLDLLLQANPNMKFVENKQNNTFIVESFK